MARVRKTEPFICCGHLLIECRAVGSDKDRRILFRDHWCCQKGAKKIVGYIARAAAWVTAAPIVKPEREG